MAPQEASLSKEALRAVIIATVSTLGSIATIMAIRKWILPDLERMMGDSDHTKVTSHAGGDDKLSPYEAVFMKLVVRPSDPEVAGIGFDTIGGLHEQLELVKRTVLLPMQRPKTFGVSRLARRPTSVLLHGPPGTGKTLLAKLIARHANAHFFSVSVGTIISKWFGDSEKLVEALFSSCKRVGRAVIFIDECDSLFGVRRGDTATATHNTQLTNAFLACWDGMSETDAPGSPFVLVIGATNRASSLDPAVMRRFGLHVAIPLPSAADRASILRVHLRHEHAEPDLDLDKLGRDSPGLSGSDLKDVVRMAAMHKIADAVRESEAEEEEEGADSDCGAFPRPITTSDLESSLAEFKKSRCEHNERGPTANGDFRSTRQASEGSAIRGGSATCESSLGHLSACPQCQGDILMTITPLIETVRRRQRSHRTEGDAGPGRDDSDVD